MNKKLVGIIAATVMTMSLLGGCGSSAQQSTAQQSSTQQSSTQQSSTQQSSTKSNAKYKDGTYKAEYDKFDKQGWKGQVSIDIKDGKIASVTYDFVNKDGKLKSQDENYKAAMIKSNNTYPAKYEQELAKSLVDKQDPAGVQAITGATTSSNEFKELVAAALKNAAEGKTDKVVVPYKG